MIKKKEATSFLIAKYQQCQMKDEIISMKEKFNDCGNDLRSLNFSKEKVDSEIFVTKHALLDLQKEKYSLLSKIENI